MRSRRKDFGSNDIGNLALFLTTKDVFSGGSGRAITFHHPILYASE